ncbi:pyridoxine 5'-phosphate oxidase C-terminal domain-containing protein [Catenuloplanes japonicus]|uniref:pyridoxine 5'-phosphate oxidase C-terminal domain-containing protein n=1 Tax=Catenuloplanes japonicus TaxID=33876 RepID=UPI0005243781|nr:pyridoxine 5'-phosphate oxidase C-terminal domain-containing protein [Catenuloplanes japonicus]
MSAQTLSGDAHLDLPEFDAPPGDPIAPARAWPAAAVARGVREPQQIHLAGPVEHRGDSVSDALFAERPRAAQATTAASRQSRPRDDEQALRRRAEDVRDSGAPIARPDGWAGYRLLPHRAEFWYGSPDRLHRRLACTRAGSGWSHQRLQP